MAAPTIPNGEEHFFPIVYEGNGTGQKVSKFVPFTDNGTIANSCIFSRFDSDLMSRTLETPTNGKIWTFSTWYKRGNLDSSNTKFLGYSANNGGGYIGISSDKFYVTDLTYSGSYTTTLGYHQNRTVVDDSKWYHFVVAVDTTLSTASDRVKIYIDGDRITSFDSYTVHPAQDYVSNWNGGSGTLYIGRRGLDTTNLLEGYMAETNFVDGTALGPDTFGITDTSTGRWIPKTLSGITYGNSGWRLTYADSSNLGDDTSGNTNDFTVSNITSSNQTIGSPSSNYSTFTDDGSTGTISLADGNLKPTFSSSAGDASGSAVPSTFRIPVGKWYFEYYIAGTNSVLINMAVAKTNTSFSGRLFTLSGFKTYYPYVRSFYEGSSELVTDTDMPIGEDDTTVGVYIERKSDGTVNLWAGDDQASKGTFAFQSSMNPATGANAVGNPFSPNDELRLYIGNDGNGNYSSGVRGTFNFGQLKVSPIDSGTTLTDYTSTAGGYFRYQPVTGFKALQQDNVPTIDKGISGLTWTKDRDATASWMCIDSSRTYAAEGDVAAALNLNNTNKEYGQIDFVDGITKFLKGGFVVNTSNNSYSYMNKSGNSNVSYSWVANGGSTATNETGSIVSSVQANTTAGFSIVTYTGTGSSGSVGHGLSAAPVWMIFKDRENDSTNWRCYHKSLGGITKYIMLNSTDAAATASMWGSPTSSAFIIGGTGYEVNESGTDYVAYCWHEVEGFSKFGKYTGNGNSDGPFVYTGFRPAMVMVKSSSNAGTGWEIRDNKRSSSGGSNPITQVLYPYLTQSELTTDNCDFLANGFKWRSSGGNRNESGYTYIYMAFAEHPFVGDGTNPVTAR